MMLKATRIGSLSVVTIACLLLAAGARSRSQDKPAPQPMKELTKIENFTVWQREGETSFIYKSKMTIDADGSPKAYHPDDVSGLDDLSNGGKPGSWWAMVTDTGGPTGTPIIQGPKDPAPGFYVSMTSLVDATKPVNSPTRYVDATKIPFFVLPPPLIKLTDAQLGDFALVVNTHNDKRSYAIFADIGPEEKLGEGSIALGNALGLDSNARSGGTGEGIVFLVFPHSGNGKPRSVKEIRREGEKQFKKWGGLKRLKAVLPTL